MNIVSLWSTALLTHSDSQSQYQLSRLDPHSGKSILSGLNGIYKVSN